MLRFFYVAYCAGVLCASMNPSLFLVIQRDEAFFFQ